jgi:hypothetical protein
MDNNQRIENLEKKIKTLRAFYLKIFITSILSVFIFFASIIGGSYLYIKAKYGSIIEGQIAQIKHYQKKAEDIKKIIDDAEKMLSSIQKDMDKVKNAKNKIDSILEDRSKLVDKLKKL